MYKVEVGRYSGAYKPRYTFDSYNQAVMWFNGINVGRGYKKRLVEIDGGKKKTLARVITSRWN